MGMASGAAIRDTLPGGVLLSCNRDQEGDGPKYR